MEDPFGLYQRYYNYAHSVAINRSYDNKRYVEDVVQETLIHLIDKVNKKYSGEIDNFDGWCKCIITNKIIDMSRKFSTIDHVWHLGRTGDVMTHGLDSLMDRSYARIDAKKIKEYMIKEILKKMNELSPVYRKILDYYYCHDYTVAEISDVLDISEGTVKSNLCKGRRQLRSIIPIEEFQKA